MSEEKTNTQKIMKVVDNIPELSKTWSTAIENQNDETISKAWNATLHHYLPGTGTLKPQGVLNVLSSDNPTIKNKPIDSKDLKVIAEILANLDCSDCCFGREELAISYTPKLVDPNARIVCNYYVFVIKSLEGFFYRMADESGANMVEPQVGSGDIKWQSQTLASKKELIERCRELEREEVSYFATWILAFTVQKHGANEEILYKFYVSDNTPCCYIEEPDGSEGDYQIDPLEALENSSLKMDKTNSWKITEGSWNMEKILEHFDWQDLDIHWYTYEEEDSTE